ncbi:MAG TPA: ABC transporter permease [Candidatus Atribacteria bacterium]|nr:ABC transporter permease [Candidatus Atribacteria bacterium]
MNDMLTYTIKRLFQGVFVVIAVTVIVFSIMQLMPGDPIRLICNPRIPQERIEELRHLWGLDKPIIIQYFYWFSNVVKGDFGTSIISGQKVSTLIAQRLPYTLMLTGPALLLEFIISVFLGLIAAYKRDSIFDKLIVNMAIILRAIPIFWLGILFIMLFSLKLRILPVSGYSGFKSLILPLSTLVLPYLATNLRLTRSEVLEVLRERMVLTAYAKGLNDQQVLFRHVLRNALIPTTVLFFLSLPWIFGGSVIIESIFAWPGTGKLLWKSIVGQDFPVVQGIIFIIALLTVISNTMGDIIAAILDPRIRLEIKGENA